MKRFIGKALFSSVVTILLFSVLAGGCAGQTDDSSSTLQDSTAASSSFLSSLPSQTCAPLEYAALTDNEKLIYDMFSLIHSGEGWQERYRRLMAKPEDFQFLSDPDKEADHFGLLNIKSARVVDIQKLSEEEANTYVPNYDRLAENGQITEVYLTGVDCDTHEDTAFYFTGINYMTCVLEKKGGEWLYLYGSSADSGLVKKLGNPLLIDGYLAYRAEENMTKYY